MKRRDRINLLLRKAVPKPLSVQSFFCFPRESCGSVPPGSPVWPIIHDYRKFSLCHCGGVCETEHVSARQSHVVARGKYFGARIVPKYEFGIRFRLPTVLSSLELRLPTSSQHFVDRQSAVILKYEDRSEWIGVL